MGNGKATRRGAPPQGRIAPPAADLSGLGSPAYPGLSAREQEIASIVHAKGAAAANELEEALADMPASVLRSMLGDLVAKGVLNRTDGARGTPIISPALRLVEMQEQALAGVVDEHFEGSLEKAVRLLILLVHKRQPEVLDHLALYLKAEVER